MRKLMFSTAAILALSLSAFAGTPETKETAEAKVQSKQMANLYIHVGDGLYRPAQVAGSETCNQNDPLPCKIESDEWEPDGFEYSNKPADSQESAETGKYQ